MSTPLGRATNARIVKRNLFVRTNCWHQPRKRWNLGTGFRSSEHANSPKLFLFFFCEWSLWWEVRIQCDDCPLRLSPAPLKLGVTRVYHIRKSLHSLIFSFCCCFSFSFSFSFVVCIFDCCKSIWDLQAMLMTGNQQVRCLKILQNRSNQQVDHNECRDHLGRSWANNTTSLPQRQRSRVAQAIHSWCPWHCTRHSPNLHMNHQTIGCYHQMSSPQTVWLKRDKSYQSWEECSHRWSRIQKSSCSCGLTGSHRYYGLCATGTHCRNQCDHLCRQINLHKESHPPDEHVNALPSVHQCKWNEDEKQEEEHIDDHDHGVCSCIKDASNWPAKLRRWPNSQGSQLEWAYLFRRSTRTSRNVRINLNNLKTVTVSLLTARPMMDTTTKKKSKQLDLRTV